MHWEMHACIVVSRGGFAHRAHVDAACGSGCPIKWWVCRARADGGEALEAPTLRWLLMVLLLLQGCAQHLLQRDY